MAEINRYTQMPQPLTVNPISFEEFSRIPIAKAKAEGAGVAALERIKTDYNVDDADLGSITQLVSGIDKSKESIVEDISNNGINSQTVGNVIKLKRERDNLYKTKIQQAEENKKLLYDWRQNIDKMTMQGVHPAWYGEHIKQKEYKTWVDKGGSFQPTNEEGLPTMFQSNFGVKYIDMDEDIRRVYAEASRQGSQVTKSWGAGAPTIESMPAPGGKSYDFWTSSGGGSSTKATNKANLDAAMNLLLAEYTNPNTERGKFVNYADVNIDGIKQRLEMYKNEFLDTKNITQVESKTRQLMGKKEEPTSNTGLPPYDKLERQTKGVKINDIISSASGGAWEYWSNVASKTEEKTDLFTKAIPIYNVYKTITNAIEASKEVDEANKMKTPAIFYHDVLLNGLVNNEVKGYENKISLHDVAMVKVGNKEAIDKVYGVVKDYMKKQSSINLAPEVLTGDYLKAWFGQSTKSVPERTMEDVSSYGHNVYTIEGDVVKPTSKEGEELKVKMLSGKTKATGTIPLGSPLLIEKKTKNVLSQLTSGTTFIDKETGKSYIMELPEHLKKSPEYSRIEELNNYLLDLPAGGKKDIIYLSRGGKYMRGKIKHDETRPYTYMIEDTPGHYTDISPEQYTTIHSPDFFKQNIKRNLTLEEDYTY